MAVVSVTQATEGESDVSVDGRSYRAVYLVRTDDPNDGPAVAQFAEGVPRMFDAHPVTQYATVRSIAPRMVDRDPCLFEVTVVYETHRRGYRLQYQEAEDPIVRVPEIEWGTVGCTAVAEWDINNLPIVNTAGQKYDPPIEYETNRMQLSIARFYEHYDAAEAQEYANAINTDIFFGAPPFTAKVKEIHARPVLESGLFLWYVSWVFHFRFEGYYKFFGVWEYTGWIKRVLSCGFMEIDSGGNLVNSKDANGDEVAEPILLNSTGHRTTTPFFQTFHVQRELPFAPLGLEV